jgi:DNA-binding transcriptional MerR regulator
MRLRSRQAASVVGVKYATLDYWVRHGILGCAEMARGTGTRRGWTVQDMVKARILSECRNRGLSLEKAAKVLPTVDRLLRGDEWAGPPYLVFVGDKQRWFQNPEAIVRAVMTKRPEESVVVLPIADLVREVQERTSAVLEGRRSTQATTRSRA